MSPKSTRQSFKYQKYEDFNTSATKFCENAGKPSNTQSVKKVRKIRNTNDMIFFDTSLHENKSLKNKSGETLQKTSPLPKVYENSSPSLEGMNKNSIDKTSTVSKTSTPYFYAEKVANDHCNGKFVLPENIDLRKQPEDRKIVRARRLLKHHNNEKQKSTQKKEHEASTIENTMKTNLASTGSDLQTPEVQTGNEEHPSMTEKKKPSLNVLEMAVKTLPSPISPSENSIEINTNVSTHSQYLQFESSKEELHPSTSGVVNPPRRRTYELEDSINDISLLKSASARDSIRLNSFPSSEDKEECKTPSKVTMRRKWKKADSFSAQVSDSPKWVQKLSSFTNNIGKPESQNGTSTSKKPISKVKMPNFAAIHARALERIESITEYKQRKDERAKHLLSGLKPKNMEKSSSKKGNQSAQRSSNKKESRKQLRFAPNSTLKDKSPTFIPLPSTPLPKHFKHYVDSPETEKKFNFVFSSDKFNERPFKQLSVEKKEFTAKNNGQDKIKIPNFIFSKENKFTQNTVFKEIHAEKRVLAVKNFNIKETFKGFSCKTRTNEVKKSQIKSIVTKSKPTSNNLESRRCAIKGVRSNRRFDLLMEMRKGK